MKIEIEFAVYLQW